MRDGGPIEIDRSRAADVVDAIVRVRRLAGLVGMVANAEALDESALAELGWTLEERFDAALADLKGLLLGE